MQLAYLCVVRLTHSRVKTLGNNLYNVTYVLFDFEYMKGIILNVGVGTGVTHLGLTDIT